MFHGYTESTIDEKGVYPHHAIILNKEGKAAVIASVCDVDQSIIAIIKQVVEFEGVEFIYAFDRFCLPNQGTTLKDCVAGHHYKNGEFKPFIIEYQHEPRIVYPINWENESWNKALSVESEILKSAFSSISAQKTLENAIKSFIENRTEESEFQLNEALDKALGDDDKPQDDY